MSTATLTPSFGDFDEWEREFAPARLTQPIGEPFPQPDETLRRREHRPARRVADMSAIDESWREWR